MSVYRYTRRGAAEAAADASSAVEVTLTNPEFKAELDRTMDRMGFEFAGSREEFPSAVAPGFPAAWPSAGGAAEAHGDAFMDRPTPVAGSPRAGAPSGGAPHGIEPPHGIESPLRDFDAAALGFQPSWDELPQGGPRIVPLPEAHTTFPFKVRFESLDVVALARRWAWVVALFVPILVVHGGTLGSTPSAEELVRLYDGAAHGFVSAVVKQEGVQALPLSRLLVWGLHQVFGFHTGWLFLVPLIVHFVCATLLRRTLLFMTKRPVLSTVVAGLWAISPVHRGTLDSLYSLGAVVATAATLVVISGFVTRYEEGVPTPSRRLIGWSALLVGASLADDMGTAFALATPAFVPLFVQRGDPRRRDALWLLPAAFVALGLYVAVRWFGPPEPLGKFIRGLPLFLECFAYGLGNLFVGPFVVVGPGGEPAALIGSPGASAGVVFAGAASFLVVTAAAWALARRRSGSGRQVAAFAVLACVAYLFAAFDGAKYVAREGIPSIAVQPEAHYAAMSFLALSVGLLAAGAKPLSFRQPFVAPALVAASSLFLTLLAWPAASHVEARKAPVEKGVDDAERALERAVGATEEGHDAYLENVDLWFVPRQIVGRNRARFPGLFSYFVLAHSGGEIAGRNVHFVEADAKVVAQIRETSRPKIAAFIESADEARQKAHAVTTPRLSRSTSPAAQGSAAPRRPPRTAAPRARKQLPFKPDEAPK
jgi:hypothetical protein